MNFLWEIIENFYSRIEMTLNPRCTAKVHEMVLRNFQMHYVVEKMDVMDFIGKQNVSMPIYELNFETLQWVKMYAT